jgi:release factor glutamine methyltransferase
MMENLPNGCAKPKLKNRWTVRDILSWTSAYFAGKGLASPRLDAELLLAHCLGTDRLNLYLNYDRPLGREERDNYREFVLRRIMREPVALIIGTKEFWSLSFEIPRGVLIPRPDTEILVEAVLETVSQIDDPHILEIGTGSGAVAVALMKEMKRGRIIATDMDFDAVACAAKNAIRSEVMNLMDFCVSDLFSAFGENAKFDVICSNPPYIPSPELAGLQPEIRYYEPVAALDGGMDGLDVIRRIAAVAAGHLKKPGRLFLEVGAGQAEDVQQAFLSLGGFRKVYTFNDLAGIPRVVAGSIE